VWALFFETSALKKWLRALNQEAYKLVKVEKLSWFDPNSLRQILEAETAS
jgi:hypothetical protein